MDELDKLKDANAFLDELEAEDKAKKKLPKAPAAPAKKSNKAKKQKGGFTPGQKFALALLLFVFVLAAGFFTLLITGRFVL